MNPMYGTSGALFTVVAELASGRIGYRLLSGSTFRVRLEPANGVSLDLSNWKQPESGCPRYSTVVENENLVATLADGLFELVSAMIDPPEPPKPSAPSVSIAEAASDPMIGTTGTDFTLFAVLASARIGFRELQGSEAPGYRIRVEPINDFDLDLDGWNQPDPEQNRYSTVVRNDNDLADALDTAVLAATNASLS